MNINLQYLFLIHHYVYTSSFQSSKFDNFPHSPNFQSNIGSDNKNGAKSIEIGRLLILIAGGTLCMIEVRGGGGLENVEGICRDYIYNNPLITDRELTMKMGDGWMYSQPTLNKKILRYKIEEMYPLLDSTNEGIEEFVEIGRIIQNKYKEYDYILVVQGTDTVAYAATFLSFALTQLHKTIILTCAMKPIFAPLTDAYNSLLTAFNIVTIDICINEVIVAYNSQAIRGSRATKYSTHAFDSIRSPYTTPLIHFPTLNTFIQHNHTHNSYHMDNQFIISQDVEMQEYCKNRRRKALQGNLSLQLFDKQNEDDIIHLHIDEWTNATFDNLFYGSKLLYIKNMNIFKKIFLRIFSPSSLQLQETDLFIYKAIILQSEQLTKYGILTPTLEHVFELTWNRNIFVIIHGNKNLINFQAENKRKTLRSNIKYSGDMTFEAILTKSQYLLRADYQNFRERFDANLRGEITIHNNTKTQILLRVNQIVSNYEEYINKGEKDIFEDIHYLVKEGKGSNPHEILEYLIETTVPLNIQNNRGRTPLHFAILKDDIPSMHVLCFLAGINPTLTKDSRGLSPFDYIHLTNNKKVKQFIQNYLKPG